jgi:hypothetical protein
VFFIDELPWLTTAKSKLIEALDYAWNTQLSLKPAVKLVICGSAASWMIKNIVSAASTPPLANWFVPGPNLAANSL